jgi:hypothetical protein
MSHSTRIASRFPSRRSLSALLALALWLAAQTLAAGALAQGLDPSKIKDLPHFDTLTQEQFDSQTDVHTVTPQSDKYLAYSIRLPKGWQKASSDRTIDIAKSADERHVTHRVLGRVAKYFAPQTMEIPSYIDIEALELDFNISARNWFLNYIIANGYTLIGMKEVAGDREMAGDRLYGLYVRVVKDQSYIVRTVAQINGPRIVVTSYCMPEQKWEEEKALQEKIIASFKFLNPEPMRAEGAHTYVYLDLLRFDYPQSWQLLSPTVNSIEGMDVRLIDSKDKETLNGEIDIHILNVDNDKTLAQQIQDLRATLRNQGLEVGSLMDSPSDYKFHRHIYFNKVEVYDAHGRDNEFGSQEVWICVLLEDRYTYIISMITPGRNNEFLKWAKNIESFRTVVQSFRL